MEGVSVGRFKLGKQSSMMPGRAQDNEWEGEGAGFTSDADDEMEVPATYRLMYLAHEADVEGIRELLKEGTNVNFQDMDGRTALHIAACQGHSEVVELLIQSGAVVDPKDKWGSTPLADAIHYKKDEVITVLEKYGAKHHEHHVVPMLVKSLSEVPEYEIDPKELDFSDTVQISKGTFCRATWRGIQVAVKILHDDFIVDEDKVIAFRDELALLQQLRHPNVVQFLGAVTQSTPMMIVTEYLSKGDLCDYLKKKGALKPRTAVKFALDIARGMNYLHERKPEAIIHRDLEPSNILRDDSGNLKVADFGVSKFLKLAKTVKEDKPLTCEDTSCRYTAPEVFLQKAYDTKADVFSFSLILYEMIEGKPPFSSTNENEVPNSYAKRQRPSFTAPLKLYSHGLKDLIEECWSNNPDSRPTFKEIINRLSTIQRHLAQKKRWKVRPLKCFQNIEAIWKRDNSDPSSRSSWSSHR